MCNLKDRNELSGDLILEIYRNNVLIEAVHEQNLILNNGKELLSRLLAGETTDFIAQVGMGTSNIDPLPNDSELSGAIKVDITNRHVEGPSVIFRFVVDNETANGLMISEFGLYSRDNVLFSRRVRVKPLPKDEEIYFTGTWTIRF